ncbi:MAG TPA: CorA family divalent cation transporter [Gemmatimonadales bacterium]|jgi:magnesium transporter|nr:CorA family divalent cation transporter [Gemmatimonadales bacterium]
MLETVLRRNGPDFEWLDATGPTPDELAGLAESYGLHPMALQDCLDPEHLPKFEKLGGATFVIVRAYDVAAPANSVTIQQMTRKVAAFAGLTFLLTVHRKAMPFFDAFKADCARRGPDEVGLGEALVDLIAAVVATYEKPLEEAEKVLDDYEEALFDGHRAEAGLEEIHVVKRRVTLIKRTLWQTLGVVQKLHPPSEGHAPIYQDLRESIESLYTYADEIHDNVNNLLTVQLNIASHRTNEVMRVLTVFSAFFLPLTFIVGIYGMNFQFMPELGWRFGYPLTIGAMVAVCLAIFLWFRRRGWMR